MCSNSSLNKALFCQYEHKRSMKNSRQELRWREGGCAVKNSDLFNLINYWVLSGLKLVMKVDTQLLVLENEYLGAYSV